MHTDHGRSSSRIGLAVGGACLLGALTFLAAMAIYLKIRSLAVPIEVGAACLAGSAAWVLLRRATPGVRGTVAVTLGILTGVGCYLAVSAVPPSSDQLQAATRLVHDSSFRSSRQVHDGGFVNDTQFCIPSCEVQAEQSDFDASVDDAVRDIVQRLEGAGYRVKSQRGSGSFVDDFEADPGQTEVIDATRGSVDLLVSVAPSDGGSVVASFAD